jgi:GNAT superfamily N-acetyltransferase
MNLSCRRLSPALREDFYRLHSGDCAWCYCTAWHVPTWEGWTERGDEDNRALREALFEKGDGYILYTDGEPAGWMQAVELLTLPKLASQHELAPQPGDYAVSCLMIPHARRKQGLAHKLLALVLANLKERGAKRVYAFPLPPANGMADDMEVWTGPRPVYEKAGFVFVKGCRKREVWTKELR